LKFTRKVQGIGGKAESLFDKLHDKKAGTPTGGGVLLVVSVVILFAILFPLITYLGVYISTSYRLASELLLYFYFYIFWNTWII